MMWQVFSVLPEMRREEGATRCDLPKTVALKPIGRVINNLKRLTLETAPNLLVHFSAALFFNVFSSFQAKHSIFLPEHIGQGIAN